MAALYVHNAIFTADPAEMVSTPTAALHSRTISTVTLRTVVSNEGHPTESLLGPSTSGSHVYMGLLARQPNYPDDPPPHPLPLYLTGDPMSERERRVLHEAVVRKRLKLSRGFKIFLEALMGAWVTYNMVRYFISYVRYTSSQALTISLSLGTSVTVSLTLLISALLLAIFQPLLFLSSATNLNLRTTRLVLHGFSSLTLLGPAIVNLVFTFVWRWSLDDEVRVEGRCHLDVDVIWSGPSRRCDTSSAPPWIIWLALAALRVFLTAVVVTTHHFIARVYHQTRRPSSRRTSVLRSKRRNLPKSKTQTESDVTSSPQTTYSSPQTTYVPQKPPFVMSLSTPRTSRTTLVSPSRTASLYGSPRSHRSSRTFFPSGAESITPRRSSESALKATSVDTEDLGSESSRRSSRRSSRTRLNEPLVGPDTIEEDSSKTEGGETQTVAGRLRAILTQMSRETDEALDIPPITFANPSSPVAAGTDAADSEQDTFNPYEDYSRPRATRDHVRVLGGYIRRMPTIESLSSREVHSSIGHRDNGGAGAPPSSRSSRPSTRETGKSSKNQPSEPSSCIGSVGHAAGRSGTPEVPTPPDDVRAHSVRSFDERNHGSSGASSPHDTLEHSEQHHQQDPNG